MASTNRILSLIQETVPVPDLGTHELASPTPGKLLDHISFQYPGHSAGVLISLDIPAGTTFALVGTTGSGKIDPDQTSASLHQPTQGQTV